MVFDIYFVLASMTSKWGFTVYVFKITSVLSIIKKPITFLPLNWKVLNITFLP